jgi:hypothetical protein
MTLKASPEEGETGGKGKLRARPQSVRAPLTREGEVM